MNSAWNQICKPQIKTVYYKTLGWGHDMLESCINPIIYIFILIVYFRMGLHQAAHEDRSLQLGNATRSSSNNEEDFFFAP